MTYRVSRQDLAKGTRIEAREHPNLSERNQRRVARDHLERYGPGYYDTEKMTEAIIKANTKKQGAKPIRHHKERPYNPMTDGLPRSARSLNL